MKLEINHHSNVIDFLKPGFDYDKIDTAIKNNVRDYSNSVNIKELEDWKIVFIALYSNVKEIQIYKKTRSYKSEKYKDIVVHIPLPTSDEAGWGMDKDKFVETGATQANVEKYANVLQPLDFKLFDNHIDYIVASMTKAIKFSFKDGYTINGKKVKIDMSV